MLLKRSVAMLSQECVRELKNSWLPNITNTGLDRVIDLLEKGSPLLIHGSFTRTVPMGCLATHIAWNHPRTSRMTLDAGICWLNHIAELNPATSHVIREWDRCADFDYEMRCDLAEIFRQERASRQQLDEKIASNRIADLVTV
jgi:hypothetical protein